MVFAVIATVALVTCFVAVLVSGSPARAGAALLGGLVVVGVAALLLDWSLSGLAEPGGVGQPTGRPRGAGQHSGVGFVGGFDGGGHGGGGHGGGGDGGGGC